MNLEFTVTETITRSNGQIEEINYKFDEVTTESLSLGLTNRKETRNREYSANITREQYNHLIPQKFHALPFDDFVYVLRPFMMGFYDQFELERAFSILDRDGSGSIQPDELSIFLPIINQSATGDTLKNYLRKVNINDDSPLNFGAFQSLILKGIGRDILCNQA